MRRLSIAALVLAFFAGQAAAAQMYRWVDDKGNVEYRDTPPPATAKKVERRDVSTGNMVDTSTMPYSLQVAVKNHPVTLWAYDCGDPCTRARVHLSKRGIPYTERNPQKEPDAMKKATGSTDVPVLFVGSNQLKGYLDTAWDSALDTAGYPKSPPPGYKPPPPGQGSTPAATDPKGKPGADPAPKGTPAPAAK